MLWCQCGRLCSGVCGRYRSNYTSHVSQVVYKPRVVSLFRPQPLAPHLSSYRFWYAAEWSEAHSLLPKNLHFMNDPPPFEGCVLAHRHPIRVRACKYHQALPQHNYTCTAENITSTSTAFHPFNGLSIIALLNGAHNVPSIHH